MMPLLFHDLLLFENERHKSVSCVDFRSSRPEVFYKKRVLRDFAKFTGKHLCQSLFFDKVAVKRRLWHRCFPVDFATFLICKIAPFLQSISRGCFHSFTDSRICNFVAPNSVILLEYLL